MLLTSCQSEKDERKEQYQDVFPSQDLVTKTKYCKMILCGGRVCLTEQQNPGIKVKVKQNAKSCYGHHHHHHQYSHHHH